MKFLFFLAFFPFAVFAQSADSVNLPGDEIFIVVDSVPEYPGGMIEMYKMIAHNIMYPKVARHRGETGTVYVGFVVGKDGVLRDIKTVKGVSPLLDAEAERVVALLPPWRPGIKSGKPVNVKYVLPIKFQLDDERVSTDTVVYLMVDKMPTFRGAEPLKKYIERNLKYPAAAKKQKIKGTVFLQFVVETDGSISNIKTIRGLHPDLDAEAERVVKTLPGWNPGELLGKKVRVRMTVNVAFK